MILKLLTIDELSTFLQVAKSSIYKWTHENKIPHIKLPNNSVRFDQHKIEWWLKQRSVTAQV